MYEFDVFISYKRTSLAREWLQKYFVPKLESFLTDSLPTPPRVFVDERNIEHGAIWRTEISNALKRSKCLVAVLNAPYFTSQYCRAEWQSFVKREVILNATGTLIKPVQFYDGEHFDPSAHARQIIDMRPWATSAPAFPETREFLIFEQAVKGLAALLSDTHGPILMPATYQDWPVVDPDDEPVSQLNIPQPKLGA